MGENLVKSMGETLQKVYGCKIWVKKSMGENLVKSMGENFAKSMGVKRWVKKVWVKTL